MNDTKYDVVEALEALGIKRISVRGNEVNFSCPQDFHARGDRHPSASVNTDNYTYHCFSCGASGTIYTLIGTVLGVSPAIAIRWLRERFWLGDSEDYENVSVKQRLQNMLDEEVEDVSEEPKWLPDKVLDDFQVDWFRAYNSYIDGELPDKLARPFEKYNLTPQTCTTFELGYDRLTDRITIPRRNFKGQLIEVKGRSADNDDYPKYLGLGNREGKEDYKFPRIKDTSLVFGLDTATPELIICEGEFVALYMRQLGFTGSVAIGTSKISEKQLKNILNKAERATILFDPDDAGYEGAEQAIDLLYGNIPVTIALLPSPDPEKISKSEMEGIIKNANTPLEFKKFYKEHKVTSQEN